jgi:glycosyltransferase involved in cell wall biosynthesis
VKVTILTPTLDAARHLPACLRSLAAQTWPRQDLQHLVLDGGSRDETAALARAAGAEVSVERDGSLYEALNRGVALARGDVVGWLNADDVYEPDAVARAAEALRARPSAEIAVGHFRIEALGRSRLVRTRADALCRLAAGRARGAWIWPIAVFWRAQTLRGLGTYPEGYRIAADQILWMRAAARVPPPEVVHTGAVAGTFRAHGDSLSAGPDPERSLLESIDIMRLCLSDRGWPAGVRRWALAALRRNTFWLVKWRARELPLARRLLAQLRYHADIHPGGAGSLLDVREEIGATLGEWARTAAGRPTPRW